MEACGTAIPRHDFTGYMYNAFTLTSPPSPIARSRPLTQRIPSRALRIVFNLAPFFLSLSLSSCYRESEDSTSTLTLMSSTSLTSWLQLLRELRIGSTGSAALEPQPETLKYTLRNLPSDPGTPASCLEHEPFGRQDHADEGSRNAIKHECTRA
jgi:hypothetical protein